MATTSSAPAPPSPAPSRQARLTIKEAFTRLSQSITPDDARRFQSTTLKDVRQAAVEVEDKLATSRSLRNMRRVESLLNGIEHYSKVLEVLCNGTPYLPWIWAPIKLMLQVVLHQSWQRFFDSSWGRFDARFKRILSNLAQHADLIDREANAIDIAAAETMRQKLNDDFSRREKENALIQRSAAISWLNLDNSIPSQEDELDKLLAHCHSGSCDWLLKNAKIEQWMSDGQTQRFTWIYGKPGAGKSILCSSLIDHLQEQKVPVLYFFCTYRSSHSSPTINVLKSLTAQAIQLNAEVVPYIIDNYASKSMTSSTKDLRTLLPHILSNTQSGRIILDGLDECNTEEQKLILKNTLDVMQSTGFGWKMLISSQEIPTITRGLSNLSQKSKLSLSEENQSISSAIETFIDGRIATLQTNAPYLWRGDVLAASSLKEKLNKKSNGMFLWVHLVLESLEETYSLKELEEAIDLLPSDLTQLYNRLLNGVQKRLSSDMFEKVVSMLRLITHSYRPLKVAELLDAMVLTTNIINDSTKLPAEALNVCKPLIELGPGDTVVLVHFSLQK
ncbi:hypothetical protein SLS54_003616 [Diplodia seriata]